MIHNQEGDATDVFSVGKEVDGFKSHQKLRHVGKFSCPVVLVLLFPPLLTIDHM